MNTNKMVEGKEVKKKKRRKEVNETVWNLRLSEHYSSVAYLSLKRHASSAQLKYTIID